MYLAPLYLRLDWNPHSHPDSLLALCAMEVIVVVDIQLRAKNSILSI